MHPFLSCKLIGTMFANMIASGFSAANRSISTFTSPATLSNTCRNSAAYLYRILYPAAPACPPPCSCMCGQRSLIRSKMMCNGCNSFERAEHEIRKSSGASSMKLGSNTVMFVGNSRPNTQDALPVLSATRPAINPTIPALAFTNSTFPFVPKCFDGSIWSITASRSIDL